MQARRSMTVHRAPESQGSGNGGSVVAFDSTLNLAVGEGVVLRTLH